MKTKSRANRLSLIKNYIQENNIRTQEELVNYLEHESFEVTQATVSRDITDIGLKKNGEGFYVLAEEEELKTIFKTLVKRVSSSGNIVVVTTMPGAGQTVASYIDSSPITEVLGSVDGDDTIFLLVAENESSKTIANKLMAFKEDESGAK